jgi:hypothetical protein
MYPEDVSFLLSGRQISSLYFGDNSSVTDSLGCIKIVMSPQELQISQKACSVVELGQDGEGHYSTSF